VVDTIRRDVLVPALLDVLAEQTGPVRPATVYGLIAERVDLTPYELSRNKSGGARYANFLGFQSSWMADIGWVTKSRADGWLLTDEGRRARQEIPAEEFMSRYGRLIDEAHDKIRAERSAEDPRTEVVRAALENVPPGYWTTTRDLAKLSGLGARVVELWVASNVTENQHRVLTTRGQVYRSFTWADPDRTDEPRALLELEGLPFEASGRADPARHLTAEDLGDGELGTGSDRVWLVRGSAVSGADVVPQWLDDGFVSLAGRHLRDLDPAVTVPELRVAVQEDYEDLTYNQRTAKFSELHQFLHRMTIGDVVVTADGGRLLLGTIDSGWTSAADGLTRIRRAVSWQEDGVPLTEIGDVLQARLRTSSTVADLTDVADVVQALLTGTPPTSTTTLSGEVDLPELPDDLVEDLLVGREWLQEFVGLLRERRQVVLYGPPGTGKTFLALKVAAALTGDEANVRLVQFHPAYSYEDFFEGYRPAPTGDGSGVGFVLTPGPFRKIVDQARENPGVPFVLVVDEINRANLAKVFGELYFLLEYRDHQIELMYGAGDGGKEFSLPKNVYLIGTMNTADRSIALVDAAMRRRFGFLSLHPDDDHLRGVLRAWLVREGLPTIAADLLEELNSRITDTDHRVGPSYFMRRSAVADDTGIERVWRSSILPLLEELHYGEPGVDVPRTYGLPAVQAALARRDES
jgi:5-methylcytosine-specific restriction protein B